MSKVILGAVMAAWAGCSVTVAVAAEQPSVARGNEVFQYWCSACHGSGRGKPGTNALQAKYNGAVPAELEKRTDMHPDFVKLFVRQGISIMPFFRHTEISDADLDALAAYLTRK